MIHSLKYTEYYDNKSNLEDSYIDTQTVILEYDEKGNLIKRRIVTKFENGEFKDYDTSEVVSDLVLKTISQFPLKDLKNNYMDENSFIKYILEYDDMYKVVGSQYVKVIDDIRILLLDDTKEFR